VGGEPWLRGHRSDRLAGIDADLQDMRAEWDRPARSARATDTIAPPLDLLDPPPPRECDLHHAPAPHFERGEPLDMHVQVHTSGGPVKISLHYRHVNQAELYSTVEMDPDRDGGFHATVPGQYTDSPYPLQYYFVLRRDGQAQRVPDLADDLANQPYWVVRQAERTDRP
jgi:hypothetical protein